MNFKSEALEPCGYGRNRFSVLEVLVMGPVGILTWEWNIELELLARKQRWQGKAIEY